MLGRVASVALVFFVSQLGGCATEGLAAAVSQATAPVAALEKIAATKHATGFSGIAFVAS